MPTARNKTAQTLSLRTGQTIPGCGSIEISDADATVLAGHPLLDIHEHENRHPHKKTQPDAPDQGTATKEDKK